MKVITSTALFNDGLAHAAEPGRLPVGLHHSGDHLPQRPGRVRARGDAVHYDFAQSCNNAFTPVVPHLSGKLASTAKDYFGLNQKWNIGIGNLTASYFNAPASASGSELAQEAFGEGELVASPIAMASVAATVDTGTFKQPILTREGQAGEREAAACRDGRGTQADDARRW